MKKLLTIMICMLALSTGIFAYNPPVGAEDMCLLSSPEGLSGNLFTAGSISNVSGADSILVNPALTAENQRVNLNAGYTFLFDSNDDCYYYWNVYHQGIFLILILSIVHSFSLYVLSF